MDFPEDDHRTILYGGTVSECALIWSVFTW